MLPPKAPLESWIHALTNKLRLPFANQNIDCASQKKLKWRIIWLTVGSGRYFQASFISQGMELERVMEEKLTKQGETGIHWEDSGMWGQCEVSLQTTVFHYDDLFLQRAMWVG